MLSFRREARLTAATSLVFHDFVSRHVRVRVSLCYGITYEELLQYHDTALAWSGPDRPQLQLALDGHVRLWDRGQSLWLGPGEFALARQLHTLHTRVAGDPSLAITIDWEPTILAPLPPDGLPSGRLPAASVEEIRRLARRLLTSDDDESASVDSLVAAILDRLRADGIPFEHLAAPDLAVVVPPALQATAFHLGRRLSQLEHAPAITDLEADLGTSRRQVLRRISELGARFGLNGHTWRQHLDRWRLITASTLASSPGARTEDISRAVGYRDASALCHAFHDVGFPSPQLLKAKLDRLE